jgi:hypothetical protein
MAQKLLPVPQERKGSAHLYISRGLAMKNRTWFGAAAVAFSVTALTLSAPASAAYIAIDDSDLATITITAGDFEGGFRVAGNLLTTGLGNSGSITLPDGGYSIDGRWIDLGQADGARVDLLFALPANPTFTTSGIEFGARSDGSFGTLAGSFGGYIDPFRYFFTNTPTLDQNGQTGFSAMPFLSVSFVSEVPVPEPASLALLGLGLAGLGLSRRRKA